MKDNIMHGGGGNNESKIRYIDKYLNGTWKQVIKLFSQLVDRQL